MNELQPSFYAIIPADVRYCKELSANAKLLYGEITALCNKEGFCWASNKYFADLYETSVRTVSRLIRELQKNNFIEYTVEQQTNRKIYLKEARQKCLGGMTKMSRGVGQKCLHNNTVNITSNIEKNNLKKVTIKNGESFVLKCGLRVKKNYGVFFALETNNQINERDYPELKNYL